MCFQANHQIQNANPRRTSQAIQTGSTPPHHPTTTSSRSSYFRPIMYKPTNAISSQPARSRNSASSHTSNLPSTSKIPSRNSARSHTSKPRFCALLGHLNKQKGSSEQSCPSRRSSREAGLPYLVASYSGGATCFTGNNCPLLERCCRH